eukprot:SAG11_NODE_8372_length_1023_cov_7.991342_2_plen_271_part_00
MRGSCLEEVDSSQSSSEDDDDHDGRLSAGRTNCDDRNGQKLPGQDSQHSLAGAQAMDEDSSSPTSTRRASAPVSSLKDDKEFNQLVLRLQGSAGWRSLFQGKDPFSGAFEDADPGAAARKSAALFSTFANVCDSLRVENTQLQNRLIAAESDKAGLLAAAGNNGGSKGGQEEDKNNKWRKNFKFNKTFNAGLDENVEEFLLELKQAFQKAQVKNEEQRLSTFLGALGDIVSSDYARKSEKLELESGQVLDYDQQTFLVHYIKDYVTTWHW